MLFNENLTGDWSPVQEVKTKKYTVDSLILKNTQRENEFLEDIYKWTECKDMELLYRGTRDGMESNSFHEICNNQGPTITLIKNDKGHIFGGYASISWTSESANKNAPKSFSLTLTNIHNTQPTKFPSKNNGKEVYHEPSYGPIFGESGYDFYIQSKFTEISHGYSIFPKSFQDSLGKGKSIFTSDINSDHFSIQEIEVFKVKK